MPFGGAGAAERGPDRAGARTGAIPADVLETVRAGASALRQALETEHGVVPEAVHAALRELSWRDRFSGLLNRARMDELLEEASARMPSGRGGTYVVQVKLTNFRALCDRMARPSGSSCSRTSPMRWSTTPSRPAVIAHADAATFGCLLFGREHREVAYFCERERRGHRRVAATGGAVELATGSRGSCRAPPEPRLARRRRAPPEPRRYAVKGKPT